MRTVHYYFRVCHETICESFYLHYKNAYSFGRHREQQTAFVLVLFVNPPGFCYPRFNVIWADLMHPVPPRILRFFLPSLAHHLRSS